MRLIVTFLFLALSAGLFAQERSCGSMDVLEQQLQQDPDLAARMEAIERHTQHFEQHYNGSDRVVITIPVVFHIVHNGDALGTNENISDALIQAQLDQLNEDFSLTNSDASLIPSIFQSVAANTEIQFCMAQRKPDGSATDGINRVNGGQTSWTVNQIDGNLKPSTIWDRTQYLNIWSVVFGGGDAGLLGYAQFPGGSASTDGVVCLWSSIGSVDMPNPAGGVYARGRTATHEVGHWLNLRHIWGDSTCGNDFVSDTPVHNTSNGGCPTYPHYSTCSGAPVEMTMNYMDYTYDACMYMFTAGQKARMQAVFGAGGSRASITSSQGCVPPSGGGSCGTPSGLAASSITDNSAVLSWGAVSGATAYNVRFREVGTTTWTSGVISGTAATATGLAAGTTYEFQVQADCGGTLGSYSGLTNFTTTGGGGGGCQDNFEPNNSRSSSLPLSDIGVDLSAQIAASGDNDWYRFANTSTQRRIRLDLTNLPADYDLRLYQNSTLRGTSQNGGTTPEFLIYNTTKVASNWYAYVYGYNGANSNTQCYTLRISLSSTNFRTDGTTDGEVTEFEIPVNVVETGFLMFPNPANTEVTLDVDMDAERQVRVSIMDITGRIVSTNSYDLYKEQSRVTMDVSALPSGMYVVRVENGKMIGTQKLTIARP